MDNLVLIDRHLSRMNKLHNQFYNHFFRECILRKVCYCLLLLLPIILISCGDDASDQSLAVNADAVIKESELPKGKPALDDSRTPLAPVKTDQVAFGHDSKQNDGTQKIEDLPEETLRKKFQNLLIFHADDTMEVNMPKLATLILSKDESINKLKVEVLEESGAKDDKVKLDTAMEFGTKMKARLISFGDNRLDNTFTIEPLGENVQSFVGSRKKVIWQWKITPLKPGKQELKLSIQVIEKDGEAISLPARNIQVLINAKPQSFLASTGTFFEKYWQFLITAIMIPIISAFITSMIRQRGTHPKTPTPPVPANLSEVTAEAQTKQRRKIKKRR